MLEKSMKEPATPEKKKDLKLTDEQVINMIESRENKVNTLPSLEPQNTGYSTLEEALNDFRTTRTAHIKYIKATSEDLRNHFVQMRFGLLDCYQLCLMISSHTTRHISQLNEVKRNPAFPK
jgi:murein L,D-transpeptidase YcbB/YkuD